MSANPPLTYRVCRGDALLEHLDGLARLRIEVFREWPYLYEGSPTYEENYLRAYAGNPAALAVVAFANGNVVGMSTALPLAGEHAEFVSPFRRHGPDPATVFYAGESVLLRPWRGHGAGRVFFAEREAAARAGGYPHVAFCAVDRDPEDPRKPADYVPLDPFWNRLGYRRQRHLQTVFHWREADRAEEVAHTMTFWLKTLD